MEAFSNCEEFLKTSNHNKTIIHIDIDCFYAQVEILKNPSLSNKPVGIKQKNYVITSNYIARAYGIKKCMFVTEALQLCPGLILINGEDLHDYKQVSSNITDIVKTFGNKVEKLGLDENFIDVTDIVYKRMSVRNEVYKVEGHIYNNVIETECNCGCVERLTVGSMIAKEIRDKIKNQIQLTSCAGVSYNKLLAKLVTSANKPDQQTVIFPSSALSLVQNLNLVKKIPGVGVKTCEILNSLGIYSITDLQNFPLNILQKHLLQTTALKLKKASFGIDDDDLKPSGKPQSISVEDACKKLSSIQDVRVKLNNLVQRLTILIKEDGRQPTTARITIRKYEQSERQHIKESKQCSIIAEWFRKPEYFLEKIMEVFLDLFQKLVNVSKPFHLTLISISVTKFLNKASHKKSILKFLEKTRNLLVSEDSKEEVNVFQTFGKLHELSTHCKKSNNCLQLNSMQKISSELELANKSWIVNKCSKETGEKSNHTQDELMSCLKCPDTATESITNETTDIAQEHVHTMSKPQLSIKQCPPGLDEQVFSQLPSDIQQEVIINSTACYKKSFKKRKQSFIHSYFSKF